MYEKLKRGLFNRKLPIAIVLCCIALVGASLHLTADHTDTSLEDVRRLYERLSAVHSPTGFVHLQYNVHAVMRDSVHHRPTTADIDLVIGPNAMKAVTKEMEIYRDTSATVAVLPSRRMIYITTSSPAMFQTSGLEHFQQLRDSVLLLSHLLESGNRDIKGGVEREVVFQPGVGVQQNLGFDRVSIGYDPKESKLHHFRIDYKPDRPIAWVETRFDTIDYNVDRSSIALPVTDQVLSPSGELRSKYESYKLMDLRKQSANQ